MDRGSGARRRARKYLLLFSIGLIFSAPGARAAGTCPFAAGPPAPPQAYVAATRRLEAALSKFANAPVVARLADETLSKLIAAGSPAITQWMNKRGLSGGDPDRVVREWRAYHARTFTLAKYPHGEPALDTLIQALVESQYREALSAPVRRRFARIFGEARRFALERVAKHEEIARRIRAVELHYLDVTRGAALSTTHPLDVIAWGIAYDPVPNRVNIGIDALKYSDDATLFAVFAHELGHSFDPCRWGAFFEGANPFQPVAECLRDGGRSVGAKRRDDSQLAALVGAGRVGAELAAALRASPTCNKLQYPTDGIQADQLPESFADWFSAEVVAASPHARAKNLRADLCEGKELIEGSSYPPHLLRLGRIYLAHPVLRAAAGLKLDPELRHCAEKGI